MNNTTSRLQPGAVIGMIGGGQLGRMFTQEAHRMGYRVEVLCEEPFSPAAQVSDRSWVGSCEEPETIRDVAAGVDVLTVEFEHVPASALEAASGITRIAPGPDVLKIAQNRNLEKETLHQAGCPVAPNRPVNCLEDLQRALHELGTPGVLKAATHGYDGKGQVRIDSSEEAASAFHELSEGEKVYEALIHFEREISLVAARNPEGDVACFEPFENEHRNHILDVTRCPARITAEVADRAKNLTCRLMDHLGMVGVLCVEFFVLPDATLLINEIAPRPHNSGHLTVDACATSQFEQHVRSICGLPLGSTQQYRPAAMVNLLGDLWEGGEPNWDAVLAFPDIKVHLYGKSLPRSGRKMGHLTALANDDEVAVQRVLSARRALSRKWDEVCEEVVA